MPAAALMLGAYLLLSSGPAQRSKPRVLRAHEHAQAACEQGNSFHHTADPADRDAWREKVHSKVVQYAWEKLCNSIVQQVCWVGRTQDPARQENCIAGHAMMTRNVQNQAFLLQHVLPADW